MRGTDGIDIVALEDIKILENVLNRRCMAVKRMRIMAVNALDFNLLSVEIKNRL